MMGTPKMAWTQKHQSLFLNLTFWFLLLIGFFLRIRGLFHWVNGGTVHSDARLILNQAMDFSKGLWAIPVIPTYPAILYFFAGLFFFFDRCILSLGWGPWVVGEPFSMAKYTILATLFCNGVAMMTQILVYRIGRRVYGAWGGIAVLALFSFSTFHILNAHYPYAEPPATFFIALLLWMGIRIFEDGNLKWFPLSGMVWGMAVATKPNGLLGCVIILTSSILRIFSFKSTFKTIARNLLFFLAVGLLTYFVFTPYYLKHFSLLTSSWLGRVQDQYPSFHQTSLIQGLKKEWMILLDGYGLGIFVLFILSVFFNRHRQILIFLSYPLFYFLALGMNRFIDERYMDSFTPFLALIPVGALFWMWHEIKTLKVFGRMLIGILGMVILIHPLYSSVELSWLIGQKDTRDWAAEWIKRNLPLSTKVMMVPSLLYEPELANQGFKVVPHTSQTFEEAQSQADWYSASGMKIHRPCWNQNPVWLKLSTQYKPIHRFELKAANFFQVPIFLYAFDWARDERAKSIWLPKPFVFKDDFEMIFKGDFSPYGKDALGGNLGRIPIRRMLVCDQPLEILGLRCFGGPSSELLRVTLAGHFYRVHLKSYQEMILENIPKRSFPFCKWIYNVTAQNAHSQQGGFQILTDSFEVAMAAIEIKDYARAAKYLQQSLLSYSYPQDIFYWLGLSCTYLKDWKLAEEYFNKAFKKSPLSKWEFLVDQNKGSAFENEFQKLFGQNPNLYRHLYRFEYRADQLFHEQGVGSLRRRENSVLTYHPKKNRQGFLVYGPYIHLPEGAYQVTFELQARPHEGSLNPVAQIDVYSQGEIVSRILKPKDFHSYQFSSFKLNFTHRHLSRKLEFRVKVFDSEVSVKKVMVYPHLKNAIRENLSKFYQALSRLAWHEKAWDQAMKYAKKTVQYDSENVKATIFLGKLQIKKGMIPQAIHTLNKVLKRIPHHRALLKMMNQIKELSASEKEHVQQLIKEITPSVKASISFEGGIHLIGFDLPVSPVQRGKEFQIRYYWLCRQSIPGSYVIFVHFVKDSSVFQADHDPLEGKYPTQLWVPGEVIPETCNVSVPMEIEPGRYQIQVGFWNPKGDGERLPVLKTKLPHFREAVTIGEIKVIPKNGDRK
ncbi:MAG: glycosyltransferase family 39 protein [Chlamydiae bacterium]|nr:glycosyltransferase family 39 protein [Chlamydiota bacterium]MBI3276588.1 glycosyltransferase family 39 protein [Chlamydiota bacterium]